MKTKLKIIVRLLLCVSVLVSASLSCSFPKSVGPVIAIAVKYDGIPSLALYVGNPRSDRFRLPAGEYYMEAVSPEGLVYAGWQTWRRPFIMQGSYPTAHPCQVVLK